MIGLRYLIGAYIVRIGSKNTFSHDVALVQSSKAKLSVRRWKPVLHGLFEKLNINPSAKSRGKKIIKGSRFDLLKNNDMFSVCTKSPRTYAKRVIGVRVSEGLLYKH